MKTYLVCYNGKFHFALNNVFTVEHMFNSLVSNMGFELEKITALEVNSEEYEEKIGTATYFRIEDNQVIFANQRMEDYEEEVSDMDEGGVRYEPSKRVVEDIVSTLTGVIHRGTP